MNIYIIKHQITYNLLHDYSKIILASCVLLRDYDLRAHQVINLIVCGQ